MVKHFIMGRIHAENITKAIDKLGKGVVSIKPCDVQVRDDVTWYEYVREVGGGRWSMQNFLRLKK